jgi:DnaK suppressor protein
MKWQVFCSLFKWCLEYPTQPLLNVIGIGARRMKKQDLDYFKMLLNDQLAVLFDYADHTVQGLLDVTDNIPDPLDRASFESDRSILLRIRDRESYLIRKIKRALDRLEDGTFGICELCGKEISIERLKVRPVTLHCIKCKIKMEEMEKASGY